jgi:hypothetical protein
LTLDEAKSGYPLIAKHFADIDIEHKGYVTANDVRAWRIMRKAARRLTPPPPDKLKPLRVYQRHFFNFAPPLPARTAALPGDTPVFQEASLQQR